MLAALAGPTYIFGNHVAPNSCGIQYDTFDNQVGRMPPIGGTVVSGAHCTELLFIRALAIPTIAPAVAVILSDCIHTTSPRSNGGDAMLSFDALLVAALAVFATPCSFLNSKSTYCAIEIAISYSLRLVIGQSLSDPM